MDATAYLVGPEKRDRDAKGLFLKGHSLPGPGHPKYTPELAQEICYRVASGETIAKICTDPWMPHKNTFFDWLHEHEEFERAYRRAKECYAEDVFDGNLKIATDCLDELNAIKPDDALAIALAPAKVRATTLLIRTRNHTAAKLAPKRFGTVIEPPPPPPPILPSERPEDAKVVHEVDAERHPLYNQLAELQKKVVKKPPAP